MLNTKNDNDKVHCAKVREGADGRAARKRAPLALMKTEHERQLMGALEEFLAPATRHLDLIWIYVELGDVGGVCSAMENLLSCMRAAAITHRELVALRASKEAT